MRMHSCWLPRSEYPCVRVLVRVTRAHRAISMVHWEMFGTIPNSIGLLTALRELSFQYNQLSGTIPSALGQLSTLAYGRTVLPLCPSCELVLYEWCVLLRLESGLHVCAVTTDVLQNTEDERQHPGRPHAQLGSHAVADCHRYRTRWLERLHPRLVLQPDSSTVSVPLDRR